MENITTFAFNKQESGNATYNILMTLPLYTTGPYDLNMKRNILSITIRQTLADAPYQPPYRVFLAPDYQGLHIRKTMALGDSNPCPKTTVNFIFFPKNTLRQRNKGSSQKQHLVCPLLIPLTVGHSDTIKNNHQYK